MVISKTGKRLTDVIFALNGSCVSVTPINERCDRWVCVWLVRQGWKDPLRSVISLFPYRIHLRDNTWLVYFCLYISMVSRGWNFARAFAKLYIRAQPFNYYVSLHWFMRFSFSQTWHCEILGDCKYPWRRANTREKNNTVHQEKNIFDRKSSATRKIFFAQDIIPIVFYSAQISKIDSPRCLSNERNSSIVRSVLFKEVRFSNFSNNSISL